MSTRKLPLVPIAIIISLIYWIYIGSISQMLIHYDAIGFEDIATQVYKNGWLNVLKQGPQREPIYLFTITASMHLSDIFSVDYQSIQKIIQIAILLITQLLTLKLLRMLKIDERLTLIAILYLGFSPAITTTAFRLWSEISTYPFILAIIIFAGKSWESIFLYGEKNAGKRISSPHLSGFLLGLCFLAAIFAEAIFELVFPVFIFPYIIFAVISYFKKKKIYFRNALVMILVCCAALNILLFAYKCANKKINNTFVLTNRGSRVMYGNVVRRTMDLEPKQFLVALAYAPGQRFCYEIFGSEECSFWGNTVSDNFSYQKSMDFIKQGLTLEETYSAYNKLSFKKIFKKPFRYAIFSVIESLKMFFWESVNSWYVILPSWLTKLYDFLPFVFGLGFLMAILTIYALTNSALLISKKAKYIFQPDIYPGQILPLILSMFILIITYIGLHAFFYIDPRYSVPIAPLHIALIAFLFDRLIKIKEN